MRECFMTGPPRDSADPAAWMEYATSDLGATGHLLGTLEPCPFWLVAYLAQQCAEKALKGYLIWKRVPHPMTHDLRYLLDKCKEAGGAAWTERHREVEGIGPMALSARYPSLIRTVRADEADGAVKTARRLLETIRIETGLQ